MHVTFLSHYPELYGANRSLLNLIDGLRPYGVHPFVLTPHAGDITNALLERGVEHQVCELGLCVSRVREGFRSRRLIHRFAERSRMGFHRLRSNLRALPEVVRHLAAVRTDVIYSNSSVLLSGILAAGRLRKPHVWHLREFADLDYDYVPDFGRPLQRYLINRSDGIIAVSNPIRDFYQSSSPSRIRVIENGIAWEADLHRQRRAARRDPDAGAAYTFAIVGMVHPAKGQETAVHAIHRLVQDGKRVKLVVAGAGRQIHMVRLRRLIGDLGLQDVVELRGYVHDIHAVFQSADAVLMCSTNEGMGRVTAEAMAACRPVIGFRGKGGTEDIIEHETTGLLYEGGSDALASNMLRFVEQPKWAAQLGDQGWELALNRFTIEKYAARVYDVLRSLAVRAELRPLIRNDNPIHPRPLHEPVENTRP